jgi:hypothetical protein
MDNRNTPHQENPARASRQPLKNADARDDEDSSEDIGQAGAENPSDLQQNRDIGFDRVVGPEEAGLGGGLDQAEEAQLGVTDEELAELARSLRKPDR